MKKLLCLFFVFPCLMVTSCSNSNPATSISAEKSENETVAVYWPWKWSSWTTSSYINPGSTYEVYFAPGKSGNHAIEFYKGYSGTGNVKCYWRDGSGSWTLFTTLTLSSTNQTQALYSGSASINYKFGFYNSSGGSILIQASWRFYTD